jgi:leucokinin receptor
MKYTVELCCNVLDRQVIKMLVIVVALFALCWLPLQTYNVLQDIFPEING